MGNVLIIAEAGVNHNGSLELAKELAYRAKECGADIVKYQTAKASALVSKYAEMASYQKKNTGRETSQKEMLEKLLLSYNDFKELATYCRKIGISFLSTPFDIDSIDFLNQIGCEFWKVPSGEITNYPYLMHIAETKKKVILSTGMCTLDEVEKSYRLLLENGIPEVVLLHCTTEYPAPIQDVNLKAMLTMREKFGCEVGYSDHTDGIEVPIAAVAMGAKVIEKHFTLDKNMQGPDHKASLEPSELKRMVESIRRVELALGNGVKNPSESEQKNIAIARKSIVAARTIKQGELLTTENITTKRPGNGLSPMRWNEILNTRAIRDFDEDELIEI